jgi:class 3 adenylate cyclase
VTSDAVAEDVVASTVAARLEALSDPGGLCISRMVRNQIRDKLA